MIQEKSPKRFGLVSTVGSKHLSNGSHFAGKKYFQTFFRAEEIQFKEKEKLLAAHLGNEEYLKFEDFLKKFPGAEYYFFTTDEKIHFTSKKIDSEREKGKVFFYVNKLEKLVYPEIEQV